MIIIAANRNRFLTYCLILLLAFAFPMIIKAQEKTKLVALIIDDFGNGTADTKYFLELEANFTGAVMPGLEHTESDAQALKEAGKEIILHMPMEPHRGKKSWLGPNGLTIKMTDRQVEEKLRQSLLQLQSAVGINNHMGSKVMEDERILSIIFKIAAENNLTFVDSKTTANSKADVLAQKYGVKLFSRDMFIDATDISKVRNNLIKTIEIASRKGFAIAIGHVGAAGGKITAMAIKQIYDEYKSKGVKFVTLSQLANSIA